MAIFEPIIEALESNEVRYVVVGGFAVVLHARLSCPNSRATISRFSRPNMAGSTAAY